MQLPWVLLTVIGVAFVGGVLAVPAVAFALGKSMSLGVLGRILFTIGQLTTNGSVLCKHPSDYQMHPIETRGGELHKYCGGVWIPLDGDENLSRLGKARFGISWVKDGPTLDRLADEVDETAAADGGLLQFDRDRAGFAEFAPAPPEGWLQVRLDPLVDKLHGQGGSTLVTTAKQRALEKYGGDDNLSNKIIIGGSLIAIVVGSLMGFIMFGGGA